jgi:dethiobiotin synthetase
VNIFVTAIGTDSGKTLVSSILVEALKADYWKPIQAGFPRDTDTVRSLVSNASSRFFDEAYLLQSPESPHSAATKDGIKISLEKFTPPFTEKHLIIEGAGGILVPVNEEDCVIDIASRLECKIILVSNLYLGSINHTLLTVEELKRRNLEVLGIIFNGQENPEAERIILKKTGYKCLLRVEREKEINAKVVKRYTEELKSNLKV